MTVFQQRVCDYCLAKSEVSTPSRLAAAGWTVTQDERGPLDRCPVCSFTEDTEPSSLCRCSPGVTAWECPDHGF